MDSSTELSVTLIELVVLTGLLALFVRLGLAAGSDADGDQDQDRGQAADPTQARTAAAATAQRSRPLVRVLRTALLLDAGAVALIAMGASMVDQGGDGSAYSWSPPAAYFAFQAVANFLFAIVVASRPWTAAHAWVLRLVGGLWLILGGLCVLLVTVGNALPSFDIPADQAIRDMLGMDPTRLVGIAALAAPSLLWAASFGSSHRRGLMADAEQLEPARLSRRAVAGRVAAVAAVVASSLLAWPLAATAATIELGGCAPTWLVPSDPMFCVTASTNGRTLTVSGQAGLPDGSLVSIRIDRSPDYGDPQDVAVVRNAFHFAESVHTSGADHVSVTVEFIIAARVRGNSGDWKVGPSRQPQSVVDRYGSDGAGLSGPSALWLPGTSILTSSPSIRVLELDLEVSVNG